MEIDVLSNQYGEIRLYSFGESAIVLEYIDNAERSTPDVLARQQYLLNLASELRQSTSVCGVVDGMADGVLDSIVDCIPGNQNLTILFDPLTITGDTLGDNIRELCLKPSAIELEPLNQTAPIILPVTYGDDFGPDLAHVANYRGLSEAEVIQLHSEPVYSVLFTGFFPGFPYLHGLPDALHTPRREMPRMTVNAGSIAIGGSQTGIYPIDSPGGWQIIGRCILNEFKLFDPSREPPHYLAAGSRVKFEPVTRQ